MNSRKWLVATGIFTGLMLASKFSLITFALAMVILVVFVPLNLISVYQRRSASYSSLRLPLSQFGLYTLFRSAR